MSNLDNKALTVAYVSDQKYFVDPLGKWYTTASFPLTSFIDAFPKNVKTWRFFGRLYKLPKNSDGYFNIEIPDEINVEFHGPFDYFKSPFSYIKHIVSYENHIRKCLCDADIIWAKQSYIATVVALRKKLTGKYVVTHMVGDPGDSLESRTGLHWKIIGKFARLLNNIIIKKANITLFVSESLRKKYSIPSIPSMVIHEGRVKDCQLANFEDVKKRPTKKNILYVGRLSTEKGLNILLEALKIAKQSIDINLKIIGDGSEKEKLQNLTNSLGISDSVSFVGKITWGDNLFQQMRSATMLVLPSFTEGLPLVLIESLSQGTPVIASDVGGVREAIADGDCGILVQAGDAISLSREIIKLATDIELQISLSQKGLLQAKLNTLERQIELLKHVFTIKYKEFLNDNH